MGCNFFAEQLEDLGHLERPELQLEAVFQEALERVERLALLFGARVMIGALVFERLIYQRPSQATKFCSSCRPWVWLFSGWNCTAKREPSASAAAKSTP